MTRTVLITGASSGIGEACVQKFAEHGYRIIAVARNAENLKSVTEAAATIGAAEILFKTIDLTKPGAVATLFQDRDWIKSIDCVVNCAAAGSAQSIESMTEKDWSETMYLNVTVPFLVTKQALPYLKKGLFPSIVNVSSIAGRLRSLSLGVHYTTSKAALLGLTRRLAGELGPLGIRVNATCPSQTSTPMLDLALSKERQEALSQTIPLRRLSTAPEQANVIRFLCSAESAYINGAIIDVNGGQL